MKNWKDPTLIALIHYEAISILLSNYPNILTQLFSSRAPKIRFPPDVFLENYMGLDDEEYLMLKMALEIWSGSGGVFLWEILETLTPINMNYFILSISCLGKRHGIKSPENYQGG